MKKEKSEINNEEKEKKKVKENINLFINKQKDVTGLNNIVDKNTNTKKEMKFNQNSKIDDKQKNNENITELKKKYQILTKDKNEKI